MAQKAGMARCQRRQGYVWEWEREQMTASYLAARMGVSFCSSMGGVDERHLWSWSGGACTRGDSKSAALFLQDEKSWGLGCGGGQKTPWTPPAQENTAQFLSDYNANVFYDSAVSFR